MGWLGRVSSGADWAGCQPIDIVESGGYLTSSNQQQGQAPMLYFTNPGEFDLRLAGVFGANIKELDSPIGFFGTGLKYAIAITLRLGGSVRIWSGLASYDFTSTPTVIRGQSLDLVCVTDQHGQASTMPFTLALGKAWEPWMAYREFWSNAKDEGGGVQTVPCQPAPGTTVIEVSGLDEAHAARNKYFLSLTSPVWSSPRLEVYSVPGTAIFYRGIKVHETVKPGFFTYNFLEKVNLTEDRTAASWWTLSRRAMQLLSSDSPDFLLETVLTVGKGHWEWEMDWDTIFWGYSMPERFLPILRRLAIANRSKLPPGLVRAYLPAEIPPASEVSPVETVMLQRAVEFCRRIGQPIKSEIVVVDSLATGVLGSVIAGKIVLTKEAFNKGTKCVAGTLLEEHFHIKHGFNDYTPAFQNFLIDLVVTMGENQLGSPI